MRSTLALLLLLTLAGCGSSAVAPAAKIERTFDVDWHDRSSTHDVSYTAHHIVFHAGRWSAQITLHNGTDEPLYPAPWSPEESHGFVWNGPALVYSGDDVLGNRRLIYVAADNADPEMPFPLQPGATWHSTVSGKIPATPPLPRNTDIWLRYSRVLVGVSSAEVLGNGQTVDWISDGEIQL